MTSMHSPSGSGLGLAIETSHVPAGPAGAPHAGAGVGVGEGEGDGVGDGSGEGSGVGEGDGVGDGFGEGEGEGDGLGEGLGDGAGEGEGSVPRTRSSTDAATASVPLRAVSSKRVVASRVTVFEPAAATAPTPGSIST